MLNNLHTRKNTQENRNSLLNNLDMSNIHQKNHQTQNLFATCVHSNNNIKEISNDKTHSSNQSSEMKKKENDYYNDYDLQNNFYDSSLTTSLNLVFFKEFPTISYNYPANNNIYNSYENQKETIQNLNNLNSIQEMENEENLNFSEEKITDEDLHNKNNDSCPITDTKSIPNVMILNKKIINEKFNQYDPKTQSVISDNILQNPFYMDSDSLNNRVKDLNQFKFDIENLGFKLSKDSDITRDLFDITENLYYKETKKKIKKGLKSDKKIYINFYTLFIEKIKNFLIEKNIKYEDLSYAELSELFKIKLFDDGVKNSH